jgi:hypothetical protein
MTTQEVAKTYFDLWTSGRCDAARALMADDFIFEGSMNTYRSAEAVLEPLKKFASMMKSVKLHRIMVEGDTAALFYECEMPFGTLRTAELTRVENGKMKTSIVTYDTAELRRAMAQARRTKGATPCATCCCCTATSKRGRPGRKPIGRRASPPTSRTSPCSRAKATT